MLVRPFPLHLTAIQLVIRTGTLNQSLCEKCPNMDFFSGPYFPVFSQNMGKFGPEKTPYLDNFHVVSAYRYCLSIQMMR